MMSSRTRDYAFVILASVLWGTSFPGSKVTVNTVDPLFLTFARMALGASLGMTVLVATRRMNARLFRDPMVWLLGAVNAIGFDLQNEGILLTTASKTALVVNVNVVFIAILMVLFFHEAVRWQKVAGIALGVFGVVVLATRFDPSSLSGGAFLGDVLVFVAGLVWAFYVIGAKKMVDRGADYVALTAGGGPSFFRGLAWGRGATGRSGRPRRAASLPCGQTPRAGKPTRPPADSSSDHRGDRSVARQAGLLRGGSRLVLFDERIAQVDGPVDAQDFKRIVRFGSRVGPLFPVFRAFPAHANTTPITNTTTHIRKRRIPSFKYRNRSDIVPSFVVWAWARCASKFLLSSFGSSSMSRSNSTGFGGSSYLVTR